MYEYTIVALEQDDRVNEINDWASKGYRLVQIIKEAVWGSKDINYYAVLEKPKV